MPEKMDSGSMAIPPVLWTHRPTRRHTRGPFLLLALGLILGAVVLFAFNPVHFAFYPTCRFYKATGLLCPGCGSLRAWHQLLHGHFLTALHFNPLAVVSIPIAGWLALKYFVRGDQSAPVQIDPIWYWMVGGVLISFCILRNLSFGPALWLAP